MKSKINTAYHILALFIALSLLPALMFRNTEADNTGNNPLRPLNESLTLAESDMQQYPAAIISSAIFRENYARIYQNHKSRRSRYSDTFQFCFIRNILLCTAAYILFILIRLRQENRSSSLSFIIRYIHDQDGNKIHELLF